MKQKFKRHPMLVKVKKSNRISIEDKYIKDENKLSYYIQYNDIDHIQINTSDSFGRKYKQRSINFNLKQYSKEFRDELQRLAEKDVQLTKNIIQSMIDHNVDEETFIRRYIMSSNLRSTDSKFNHTLRYGKELGYKLWKKHKSDPLKGENNPGYQHGGKLSPFSKNFVKYQDDPDSDEKIKKLMEQASDSRKENCSFDTTLEYYLHRGYSLEEAQKALSQRQSTFSLEKCIQKYGEEEGTRIWEERQQKWQQTLKSKSQEEIERINVLKSSGRMSAIFKGDPKMKELPGELYYVKFNTKEETFWKIGITSVGIEKRFNRNSLKRHGIEYEVIEIYNDTFYNCFKKEQEILRENHEHRVTINIDGFFSSECFNKDILEDLKETFDIFENKGKQ